MVRFAVDGILSFSIKPLQISVSLGMTSAAMAMVGIGYTLYLRIFTNIWVEGWTALMITILFLGGVQLISVGLRRICRAHLQRIERAPAYVVDEYHGFPPP